MVSIQRLISMRDAVIAGDAAKVRVLLKAGVPANGGEGRPFICLAAMHSREDVFEMLVASGASLHTPRLLANAVDGGGGQRHPSTAIVKRIIENNTVTQAELTECLRFACGSGNLDVVKMLLERGADANGQDEKYKFFPLHNAILKGHIEIIRELLSHGANPKSLAWGWEDNSLSGSTSTLVELALELGYCEIAKILESSHTNA